MKTSDIIEMARAFKIHWLTNDPYEIAERMGVRVLHVDSCFRDFTAHTIKMKGYPTIISINNSYTDFSKKVLCAHELGHALMHENCINHFANTATNVKTSVELEANLFALALLMKDEDRDDLVMPLEKMGNYILKHIMDMNIEKFEDIPT